MTSTADAVADALLGARKTAEALGQHELAEEISWQTARLAEVGFDIAPDNEVGNSEEGAPEATLGSDTAPLRVDNAEP